MSHGSPILLVNDDPSFIAAFADLLRTRDHAVVTAMGVAEGLACARERQPALVITDFNLGDQDAVDFLVALDAEGFDPRVRRLVITGEASTLVEDRLASVGMQVPVFRKITDLSKVLDFVTDACGDTHSRSTT